MDVSCSQSSVYRGTRPRPRERALDSPGVRRHLYAQHFRPHLQHGLLAVQFDGAAAFARAELPVTRPWWKKLLGWASDHLVLAVLRLIRDASSVSLSVCEGSPRVIGHYVLL